MLRRRASEQAGFTLVELLVVMLLLGIVGGVVSSAIISGFRSATNTTNRIVALNELEIALQRVTRDLRAADPLVLSPSGDYETALGARIDRGGTISTVSYEVREVAGEQQLVRVDTGQTLVSLLDNGGEAVFRYLDDDGADIVCSTDCPSAYLGAAKIEIRLVRSLPDGEAVRAVTSVGVRSIRYGGEAS